MTPKNQRVAFIYAPFGSCKYPAIGVSLLKSALRRSHIDSDICYPNIVLAKELGLGIYETIAAFSHPLLLGDWLCAPSIFGENPSLDLRYIQEILQEEMSEVFTPDMILNLYRIRDQLPDFFDRYVQSIDWSQYSWVGFSSIVHQHCASLALAQRIKQKNPDIRILFGGASCFGVMGEILPHIFPFIDYVCTGEGDYAVPRLIHEIAEGNEDPDIPGIFSRKNSQRTSTGLLPAMIEVLDDLPYPDYSDYMEQISGLGLAIPSDIQIPLETSRGCWWGERCQCSFCGFNGTGITYRSKSVDRAFEEIQYLSTAYGKNLLFTDNIIDNRYFRDLIPRLSTIPDLSIFLEVKANISKDRLKALGDAGCTRIHAGIESLSTPVLQSMHKGTTLVQNLQILKWGRELGVDLSWNLIYGFPGEDLEEYKKMMELIHDIPHLQPPNLALHLKFVRFSAYLKNQKKYGIEKLSPLKVYSCIYPTVSQQDLKQICFLFDAEYPDISKEYEKDLINSIIAWKADNDSRLDLSGSDEAIHITDLRRSGEKKEFQYHGVAASIYLWCDAAQSYQSICTRFSEHRELILPILEEFVKNRLMIYTDGSYVSLAIFHEFSPGTTELPC